MDAKLLNFFMSQIVHQSRSPVRLAPGNSR